MKNVSGKTSLYELLFSIPENIAPPQNVTGFSVIDGADLNFKIGLPTAAILRALPLFDN